MAVPPVTTLPTNANAPAGTVSANETLVDLYIERAIDLLRLEAGTRDKVLVLLDELEPVLVARIARIDPSASANAVVQRARLQRLLADVQSSIKGTYRDVATLMAREIREVIDVEAAWSASAVNASVGVEFADAGLTRESLSTLVSEVLIQGAPSKDWWSRQAGGLAQKFADEMRRGVVLGESNGDLIDRVRGKTGQRGIMDISRDSAERLVRSSVQTAANVGRTAMYANNADLIVALQWHATLDTRTSIMCLTRDGYLYTNDDAHDAKDGGPDWDEGPGALHWNALAEGTLIKTVRGQVPIESVAIGDSVLTHTGEWSKVTARRAKSNKGGIVRIVHMESGRILCATDDHPVRTAAGGWVFVGALESGDYLLADPESVGEVIGGHEIVDSETQYCPTVGDGAQIAIQRTLQLVTSSVDFERDPESGYREIEDRCTRMVLRDPSVIYRDQSVQHHLLATAHCLHQVGCDGLGDFLAMRFGYDATSEQRAHVRTEFGLTARLCHLGERFGVVRRVAVSHVLGMCRVLGAGLFGQTESPMRLALGMNDSTSFNVVNSLLFDGANTERVAPRVAGKRPVGQVVTTLDAAQRLAPVDVFKFDQERKKRIRFTHDRILTVLERTLNINLYDLEVEGNASYVANGLVVSNCRSTSVPILKSWKDLGIDAAEVPHTTRASMDGQVAAKTTFTDWLAKQSAARQDTILGAGKAALYRSGKIKVSDLLSQSGRPLTTEQLRAKAARS